MSAITIDGAREATVREYHRTDKVAWGPGLWQDEPDKVQWIDDATDLDCLIVRGPSGALCGYIGVLPPHPWHGKDYGGCALPEPCDDYWCDHSVSSRVSVHGGLTFASACQHGEDESRGVCHVPLNGRSDSVWWLGFDCAHYGDVTPQTDAAYPRSRDYGAAYRTVSYVVDEVRSLASQAMAVSS